MDASGSATGRPARSSKRPKAQAREVATKPTYRTLLRRGLQPDEAAKLTAYMCGIPVGESRWSIGEVNRILFLRELNRTGRFGLQDGGAAA